MSNIENIDTITLVGMGLIGGSILKGIKGSNFQGNVYGIDQDNEVIKYAFDKGLIKNEDKVINPNVASCSVSSKNNYKTNSKYF